MKGGEPLRGQQGKVLIYLADLHTVSEGVAWRYSHAKHSFAVAKSAIREMFRQTGPYEMDEGTGLLKKGVIIRHMILPGLLEDSKRIIDWVGSNFGPGQVLFSLMRQYVPCGLAKEGKYPEIGRPLTEEEYQEVEDYLFQSPIEDGFVQEASSADSQFIPAFDGTGVKGA